MDIMSSNFSCYSDALKVGESFLTLHEQDGFVILPPSSMLHDSVPMSFVMSAGLIQVENELEQIVQKTGGRFVFTQPCFRHFDLAQVANDTTHLSLFHMSAAFHIGCSEREAILSRLWQFLTEVLQLDSQRLWVTYLDDPQLGHDDESYQCWQRLGVNKTQLIGLDQQHCFWQQRSLGQIASDGKKCGPHTEVFYERIEVVCDKCQGSVPSLGDCHCGRFVEIANTLFIENYIDEQGALIPADLVFAECVVGLERLAMILLKAVDVYHITRFQLWRARLESMLSFDTQQQISVNLILDHLSAFVRLVEDGAPAPGRGGRARIMRNLARRAMTQMILHNWSVEHVLDAILLEKEYHFSLELLQREFKIFEQTLKRGQRKLSSLMRHHRVSECEKVVLEKEWGIPCILLDKLSTPY